MVFTDRKGFDSFYPFKSKAHYPKHLMSFIQDIGVPKTLVTNGASEIQKGRGQSMVNEYHINLKVTVPYQPVYFHQSVSGYPHQKRELGRLIGVADNCTNELAYVILSKTGQIQIQKSFWAIEPHKMNYLAVQADLLELNTAINNRFGNKTLKPNRKGEVRATDLPNEVGIVSCHLLLQTFLKGMRT